MPYLPNLTLRLAGGAALLDEAFRTRVAQYIRGGQREDGGFAGRQGPSDLYYTGFALRGLALIGELDEPTAAAAGGYIAARLTDDLPAVEFLSLVASAVLLDAVGGTDVFASRGLDAETFVPRQIDRFRTADGGYTKRAGGRQTSTYISFLAAASLELVGAEVPQADRLAQLVLSRQRPDGGFAELAAIVQGGTNPTAAALGLLSLTDRLDGATAARAAQFLLARQTAEGGLAATGRMPLADLLSTFTGLVGLVDCSAAERVERNSVSRYLGQLEQPDGGFRGGLWDTEADVEYTFYGLAAHSLLATLAHPA